MVLVSPVTSFEVRVGQVGCKDENQAIQIGLSLSLQHTGCLLHHFLMLSVLNECGELPGAPP